MINTGHCTPSGSEAFCMRHQNASGVSFRLTPSKLKLSSIGIGTYLGDENGATDQEVIAAIHSMLSHGCNVIDSAPNYRNGRAERSVGLALNQTITDKTIRREEMFVSTKAGIIPEWLLNPGGDKRHSYNFLEGSIYGEGFCFEPGYLEWQLNNSLRTMRIDSLDCLYLHNIETLQQHYGKIYFLDKMLQIVQLLETLVVNGQIRAYGISSWDAFRVLPDSPLHIDLSILFDHLSKAGIKHDNFKYLQLPIGIWGTEAITVKSQKTDSYTPVSILNFALEQGISVFANSALLQGDLLRVDLSVIPGDDFQSDAQRAINFARSIPGVNSLLVGIKSHRSINDAIQVLNSGNYDLFNNF